MKSINASYCTNLLFRAELQYHHRVGQEDKIEFGIHASTKASTISSVTLTKEPSGLSTCKTKHLVATQSQH